MVLFFMLAMIVHDYEAEAKKIEPSIYATVNERHVEPFQPRQYIRKIEKHEEKTKK
ncbi:MULTISPECIES: hypothetical protein [Anoxybacillus]|nr:MULTISPECIES: hypothetical protein [Anoxybacillus]MBE2904852.1 hypothetical protein [Anoxybacillus flavithermus]MBE2939872.1 hypothetical protein [Anoxybacillus flavithermus]MBE2950863.1 hypothetical protein [Anoxybacillus flavithermus]OAO77488.1 hypothetical protein A0O32_2532 [Anoxybacillus flavithermus]